MFFTASIKPTSTVHARWDARSATCGFIEGVCFVRKRTAYGARYIADKITPAQMPALLRNTAVSVAAAAVRVPDPADGEVDLKSTKKPGNEVPPAAPEPVVVEPAPLETAAIAPAPKVPAPPKRMK